MSQCVKNALLSPYQLPDSCPQGRRYVTVNGSNLKSWNALGENSDFHHFPHFNRLPKWFRTRFFCNTFHWSVSRWFSMVLTIFFAALQGNIDNAFSARELRCLCTSNSDRAWNSNFPKKIRLSKEMKPDGLICIGIILPPSITGIRPSPGSTNRRLKQNINLSGKGCSLYFCNPFNLTLSTKDPEYRLCTRCDVTGTFIGWHWITDWRE